MISRKAFIIKGLGLLSAAFVAPNLLSSCTEQSGKTTLAADACDETNLSEADLRQRQNLRYVAQSPEAAKNCANCQLYKAPAQAGECGGCQLFAGRVHPNGWCQSWVAKQA
jgi:uncharacterized paraquat-inducible protein A